MAGGKSGDTTTQELTLKIKCLGCDEYLDLTEGPFGGIAVDGDHECFDEMPDEIAYADVSAICATDDGLYFDVDFGGDA